MNILKGLTTFIGSACVGNVISNIAKNNLISNSKMDKIVYGIGTLILSGMISDKATEWVGEQFDQAESTIKNLKEANEQKKSVIINGGDCVVAIEEDTNGEA